MYVRLSMLHCSVDDHNREVFDVLSLLTLPIAHLNCNHHICMLTQSRTQPAVALVLGFVGLKMILEFFHWEISTGVSLLVVVALIGGGVGLSIVKSMCKSAKRKNSDSSLFQTAADAAAATGMA